MVATIPVWLADAYICGCLQDSNKILRAANTVITLCCITMHYVLILHTVTQPEI